MDILVSTRVVVFLHLSKLSNYSSRWLLSIWLLRTVYTKYSYCKICFMNTYIGTHDSPLLYVGFFLLNAVKLQ